MVELTESWLCHDVYVSLRYLCDPTYVRMYKQIFSYSYPTSKFVCMIIYAVH